MEQNKFEKDIQQKLDGLKIPPSESVWQHVEKHIEKKQRGNKKVLILVFLLLFMIMGGYWIFNVGNNEQLNSSKHPIHSTTLADRNQDSSSHHLLSSDHIDTNKVMIKKLDSSAVIPTISEKAIIKVNHPKNAQPVLMNKQNNNIHLQNKNISKNTTEIQLAKKDENLQNDLSQKENELASQQEELKTDSINDNNNEISLNNTSKIENEDGTKAVDSLAVSKLLANGNYSKKWNLGITISGGKSLLGNEFLGLNNSNPVYDYVSSPNPNPIPGSGSGQPSYYSPSVIKNSTAFIIGVFVEKNISADHKISLGINYKYFSTINKVGNRIDAGQTANNNFYSAANPMNNYTNHFNYLELPVLLKLRLDKDNALPIYWQAGITLSQLINSNALQFVSNGGIYYKDNSMFNKTQIGLNTAISATLFSKRKTPFTVGPYYYYSASRLAGKGLYQNKHFSFVGIRTGILFNKK